MQEPLTIDGKVVRVGDHWTENISSPQARTVRIIGIVEGYVVVRYPRAMPFCVSLTQLVIRFSPVTTPSQYKDTER